MNPCNRKYFVHHSSNSRRLSHNLASRVWGSKDSCSGSGGLNTCLWWRQFLAPYRASTRRAHLLQVTRGACQPASPAKGPLSICQLCWGEGETCVGRPRGGEAEHTEHTTRRKVTVPRTIRAPPLPHPRQVARRHFPCVDHDPPSLLPTTSCGQG